MPELPEHLRQRGRPVDQVFEAEEYLYRRYLPVPESNKLHRDMIKLPDISCIRQKYGNPQDALWSSSGDFDGYGVLQFQVWAIPKSIGKFAFKPVHTPYDKLYPHSEVMGFLGDVHLDKDELEARMDEVTQLKFRNRVLRHASVAVQPGSFNWSEQ